MVDLRVLLKVGENFAITEAVKLAGLTGGIACGKSTVASMLRRFGAHVIDADKLAREVVEPGEPAWEEIVNKFGPDILHPDRTLDRKKLRSIVFNNPAARQELETITHPKIRRLAEQRIQQLAQSGAQLIVYEAPLFFEAKVHHWLRPVILVACDPATQRRRLQERDHLNNEEIERHLQAQMSLEEKRRLADLVIENNGSLEELEQQVKIVIEKLQST
jgi:dephospho-CoA kinase